MTSDVELIHAMNDAANAADFGALLRHAAPDIVWRHNLGAGSPEEGVYEGYERVTALLERILEPWEHIHAQIGEVRDLGNGVYEVTGQLHAKHRTSEAEVLSSYVQRFEIRDGRVSEIRMNSGPIAEGRGGL